MAQPSYAYAGARIAALEKRLLDEAAVRRMAEGSAFDAMRTLIDMRYGAMADATEADIEQMIANELQSAAAELRELSPLPELTDLLLLKHDILNIKQLIKARLMGNSTIDWQTGGLYSREQLKECVQNSKYDILPKSIAEELARLEKQLTIAVEPKLISIRPDRDYLAHCLATCQKHPLMLQFFKAECDFDNVITFLRMRAMGAAKEELHSALMPEGGVTHSDLIAAYELSSEGINKIASRSVCKDALMEGLNLMQSSGNIGELEKARDNYLMRLFKAKKHDRMSIYPIIGFYLAKEREAKTIRLIMTAKRNGLSDSVILERLVELYG